MTRKADARSVGRLVAIGAAVVVLAAARLVRRQAAPTTTTAARPSAPDVAATTEAAGEPRRSRTPAVGTLDRRRPTTTRRRRDDDAPRPERPRTASTRSDRRPSAPTTTRRDDDDHVAAAHHGRRSDATTRCPTAARRPVIAIFDTTRSRSPAPCPTRRPRTRLQDLAVANAKPGQADRVDNQLTLEPGRAAQRRRPRRRADLGPLPRRQRRDPAAHAAELDRVVTIMNALPNVTALIIGHADQRGDDAARTTPSPRSGRWRSRTTSPPRASRLERLSSRAVGEADLLTLDNDDAALALNRRTEFVFIGLLHRVSVRPGKRSGLGVAGRAGRRLVECRPPAPDERTTS